MVCKARLNLMLLSMCLTAPSAFASSSDCSATSSEMDRFVSASIISVLDHGRGPNGSYPTWVENYVLDAELYAEALRAYCRTDPSATLEVALRKVSISQK